MPKTTKKKFEVEIRQTMTQAIMVTVEAEDADEASELAYEELENVDPDDWEFLDEESEVQSVEEVKGDEVKEEEV